MNKKILALSVITAVTVGSLTACNKDNRTQVEFWYSFGKDAEKALKAQVDEFEKVYPDIHVKLVTKGGYDGLKKAVSLSIPTNKTPDVIIGYPDHFAEYISKGVMTPLDSYMNSDDPEIGIKEGSNNVKNDFYDYYMHENRQYEKDDNGNPYTYGLPFNKSTEIAYYNETFFNEFAGEPYNLTVPEKYQDYKPTAEKILKIFKDKKLVGKAYTCTNEKNKNADGTYKTLDFTNIKDIKDVRPICIDSTDNTFITMTKAYGGSYTELADGSYSKGYITFDNEPAKKMLEDLKYLSGKNYFGIPDNWGKKYGSDPLKELKTFYCVGSSAGSKFNVPADDPFTVGVTKAPYYEATETVDGKEKTVTRKFVIQQGTNMGMISNKSDEIKLASWKLIRFLTAYHNEETGYDANASFALGASYIPVRPSARTSNIYKTFLEKDPSTLGSKDLIVLQTANLAVDYDDTWTKFVDPGFVGSSKIRQTVKAVIPACVKAGQKPDEAIQNAYYELPQYIKSATTAK